MVQDSKSRPMGTYYVREAIRRAVRRLMRRWFIVGWIGGAAWMYVWAKGVLDFWVLVVIGLVVCTICHGLIDRQSGKSINR